MKSSRSIFAYRYWLGLIVLLLLSPDWSLNAQQPKEKTFRSNGRTFKHQPRELDDQNRSSTCGTSPFRTVDGTCNNTSRSERMDWGATDIPLYRELAPRYGQPDQWNDMAGQNRRSPRAVSNRVVAQSEDILSAHNLSAFVFSWGQFLDHDIDLTPEGHTEYEPIPLPPNEPLFANDIPFFRSEVYTGSGTNSPRQQINLITSWIDGSNVYGSDEARANWLRTFTEGKLKVSAGNLLPYNTLDGEKNSPIDPNAPSMAGDEGGTQVVFVAGDIRAVEQSSLTSLHTLFVREHNRICDDLLAQGYTDDEFIYQAARKRVGAYLQAITYQEFLPALGVFLAPYNGYRSNVRPDISNVFATAAYRLGHTMVPSELLLQDDNCREFGPGSLSLIEAFFDLTPVETYGIEPFLKGLSVQVQQEIDVHIVDELRNFLFAIPGVPTTFELDLASLNIQRGRDHGLPDYNTIRQHYIGTPAFNFQGITNDPEVVNALRQVYNNDVNNVDAWVGMLAERPLPGSSVGATLTAVLKDQFERLRNGDFFYYENDPFYTNNDKDRIRNTRLSDILERNTNMNNWANNVFIADDCRRGGGGGGNGGGGNGGGNNGGGNNGGGPGGGPGGGRSADVNTNSLGAVQFSVFPNPTSDYLNITLSGASESPMEVQLLSVDGKVHFRRSWNAVDGLPTLQINTQDLVPGLYWVRVQTKEGQYTQKVVVEE